MVTWFSDGQPSYNTMVDIDRNMFNHVSTLFTTAGHAPPITTVGNPDAFIILNKWLPSRCSNNTLIYGHVHKYEAVFGSFVDL